MSVNRKMNQQLPTDEERAEMIIAPQAYAGIEETEEQARQGRAEISDWEKKQTAIVYEFLGLAEEKNDLQLPETDMEIQAPSTRDFILHSISGRRVPADTTAA